MLGKIEKIDIVLENCEAYTFSAKDVNLVAQNLGLNVWGDSPFLKAEHIMLMIKKQAKAISQDEDSEPWQQRIDRDITQIHLHFENGKTIVLWPEWGEDDSYENSLETDLDTPNDKTIIISPTKTMPEHFAPSTE